MLLYHAIRPFPPMMTPASKWLSMPLVVTAPIFDDAGVQYAQDLCITEGFYTVIAIYAAWRVFLGWIVQRSSE